jgi:ElaA protein
VFVVEQQCPYLDLDGRDIEPATQHLWIEESGEVVATLRLLRDGDGTRRIGRVATAPPARGRGLAGMLMRRAMELCAAEDPAATLELHAQSHLADWYAGFGFVRTGEEYVDDGIPHTVMRLRG